jgi:nucleotide-binding universal stress UspA family protein
MDMHEVAEPHEPERPLVVVGFDGSDNGLSAVRWAARYAGQAGAVLRILCAWLPPTPMVPVLVDHRQEGRERAEGHTQSARQTAAQSVPGITIETAVVEAPPTQALMDASGEADTLVVGRRGLGGVRGLLVGSVSQYCAEHARCPVVVIPETETRRAATGSDGRSVSRG